MALKPIVYKRREPTPKTMDCDGMCFPGYHVFNDTMAGLVHPHWSKEQLLPVEYCVHCGLLRVKLQEGKKPK